MTDMHATPDLQTVTFVINYCRQRNIPVGLWRDGFMTDQHHLTQMQTAMPGLAWYAMEAL